MDRLLTWWDVQKSHKVQAGVYTRNGRVISILIGKGETVDYGNKFEGEDIEYHIRKERIGNHWTKALKEAIVDKHGIKVYRKIGSNKWEDQGNYIVGSVTKESSAEIFFMLRKRERV